MVTRGDVQKTSRVWRLLLVGLISASAACKDATEPLEPAVEAPVRTPPPPPALPAPRPVGPENIYVANADGSFALRLVAGGRPAWSPDGRRIAFHRNGEVHVINADGSNDITLSKGADPTWSPDGTRIVFSSRDGISVMNADGAAVAILLRHDFRTDTYKPDDMGVGKPAWSPDGALIAFQHFGDGDTQPGQVFVMRSDGVGPRLLSAPIRPFMARYAEGDPSWSPDGSKVVYVAYILGIVATDKTGGVPNAVPSGFSEMPFTGKPVWSPNGQFIAFTYGVYPLSGRDIWIMSAAGGGAKELITDAYDAAWSPDGSRIAFASTRVQ